MNEVLQRLSRTGIVPVIAIDDAEKAVPLARALTAGGLPAAEVTFRTAAGEEAIRRIARECPEVLVGAGTVLNLEQCDRALAAGARFIVSPGYNETLVNYCVEKGVPVLPGCANASDMTRAVNAGLKLVKFFPAEQSGGVSFLKALAPVFPLDFMPTGGVNTKNLMDYLSFDRVAACGGTWMVKKDLISGGQWDEITRISREAVKTMLGFELRHVGINCADEAEAERTARSFCALLGLEYRPGNSSIFAGTAVECMKTPFLGTRGHLAIGTNSVDRAVYHLELQGAAFDESTRKTDAKGAAKSIYLKDEIGGFAVHLVQK
ncbi:bifunctional 4-hydroxy-2-oxoglutarate aldolase/2-dehydro-3-deoxy-phosphogluconate aldolase [uncultured Oscillibacter sp.]|uniref:bifunctional 4-hydroxy-2-oxoglutarate aldolase/2-dehydro-3-deoxy-phosphogluconate aldolase n=1 Tax=uncultured Oscillibacter sp. TaxID=876091 RepID=UPI0025CE3DA9|nr:bifunctional 4-hydroxy-2-oxoglutarate aldolase/2-dehydro-3-deoxy-phosphogluconate aldolase [uncultured Oscillibacter sp.]